MKNFLKYVLATITGFIIVNVVMAFIFFGIVSAFVSMATRDKAVEVKKNSVLTLTLDKPILDRKPSVPLINPDILTGFPETPLGLNELLDNIKKAGKDPNIDGIFLDLSSIQAGLGTVDELRNALKAFKDSDKFIISYSDNYDQSSYYLASVSDKIYMNPEGVFYLKGLHSELLFFKNAFDKLGIEPQVIRHGKFKSAVEPLMDTKMSPENREQIKAYMGSIWQHMVKEISANRDISPEQVNQLADKLEVADSRAAYDNRLVDSLVHKDVVLDVIKAKTNVSDKNKPQLVALSEYNKVPKQIEQKRLVKEKIAVIYAQGTIVPGKGQHDQIGAARFVEAISEARKDSSVKAIVLRVNSPGGYALAAENIWRELYLAKKVKPVIASMGDYAASGGYYIAAPADVILANPLTLTGSIGVFGVLWNAEELLNKKLGITTDVEKTNTYADFGTISRPVSDFEKAVLQKSVDKVYQTFTGHVMEGRDMTYEEVDKIGEGRVWSGINALNINLVDAFGGITDAIELAAEKAGIKEYRVIELPKQENPLDLLMKELMSETRIRTMKKELGSDYIYYETFKTLNDLKGVQARLPFLLNIR